MEYLQSKVELWPMIDIKQSFFSLSVSWIIFIIFIFIFIIVFNIIIQLCLKIHEIGEISSAYIHTYTADCRSLAFMVLEF